MQKNKMENNELSVEIVTDKTYFIEDSINISYKFNNKSLKSTNSDWIALYKCSSNRNLEEFVTVETNLIVRKSFLNPVVFHKSQLKNVKCNILYEFLYGNKFNEICGISRPIRFIHKNDCFCYPNVVLDTNHNCNCVSQELLNSLLSRMSLIDSQLNNYAIQSNEIKLMNEHLRDQLNECEVVMQKSNQLLDDLFYTNEPVTKDGYMWMQSCTDSDLKMSIILNQECELQDLSNQNIELKNILEECCIEVNEKNDIKSVDIDSNILLDSTVSVESGIIPEPLSATYVYIDSDEDDV